MMQGIRERARSLFINKRLGLIFDSLLGKGSFVGQFVGLLGALYDHEKTSHRDVTLSENVYSHLIPEVFGVVRIPGWLIWSSDISIRNVREGLKIDKRGRIGREEVRYVRASFAIAICRGPVDAVSAIYIDDRVLNLSSYNIAIYLGTEQQMPNSTMQSFIGVDRVPAFRDLCYAVFTDFPLEEFRGRMPNFMFEVKRMRFSHHCTVRAAEMVTGVTIIPGGGEFVYDTVLQTQRNATWAGNKLVSVSKAQYSNAYNGSGESDASVSLKDMRESLPNLKWVAPVVSWFADSLQARDCTVYPACEDNDRISSEPWLVARLDRRNAKVVRLDDAGRVTYGGTPSDACVLRYVTELRRLGYKVCFYPILFIDAPGKPWRGRITGTEADITRFFDHSGYRRFILHYANLLRDKVDAFIIGSEMIGLTSVGNNEGQYVAVEHLIALARDVKRILGQHTLITYAADWSEYHHTEGGWFNLDDLWSCEYIDVIGIDAYFPLSYTTDTLLDEKDIMHGWESGEGYDHYYLEPSKITKRPLSRNYAWKDIRYFWENVHHNPDGRQTSWVPMSKKIWFTEYGFPSVDCATNQPNVFFSRDSIDAAFPILSKGCADFNAQRAAILATEQYWQNSDMVEQKFLWTWDARPYPFFPSLSHIWSDSDAWKHGHFVNGKLNNSTLGALVAYLCNAAHLRDTEFDVTALSTHIDGYVINNYSSALKEIARLAKIFFFDAYIEEGRIVFKMLKDASMIEIDDSNIAIEAGNLCSSVDEICHPTMMPDCIEIFYIDRHRGYRVSSVRYDDPAIGTNVRHSIRTNTVLAQHEAMGIAQRLVLAMNAERKYHVIHLLPTGLKLKPLDVLILTIDGVRRYIRIQIITVLENLTLEIIGVACDVHCYGATLGYDINLPVSTHQDSVALTSKTIFEIIDVSNYSGWNQPDMIALDIAVCGSMTSWPGCRIFISCDGGRNYDILGSITTESIMGKVIELPSTAVNYHLTDNVSRIVVALETDIINRDIFTQEGNLALLGDEIVSFKHMNLLENGLYEISGLLRGRHGTEASIAKHLTDERFILLTNGSLERFSIPRSFVGQEVFIKVVSFGESIHEITPYVFTVMGNSAKDLAAMTKQLTHLSNGGWVFNWVPRPHTERNFFTPDGMVSYSYDVLINDDSGRTVRKAIVRNSDRFVYSVKDQCEDFGNAVSSVDFGFFVIPSAGY